MAAGPAYWTLGPPRIAADRITPRMPVMSSRDRVTGVRWLPTLGALADRLPILRSRGMAARWAHRAPVGSIAAVVVPAVVIPAIVAMLTMVVPCVVPVVVGNAAVVVPIEGPAQPPTERDAGAVGDERFVDHHRVVDVDDLRVILGDVDDLRIRGFNADDLLLHDDDLFIVVGKHPLGVGFGAD